LADDQGILTNPILKENLESLGSPSKAFPEERKTQSKPFSI